MPKRKRNTRNADGWKDVPTGGFAPFVVWKPGMVVEGVVNSFREYKYQGKVHRAMEVANPDTGEIVALPDNFALQNLFSIAKPGDQIRVSHTGVKKLGKKKTLKEFKVQHKPA